VAFASWKLAVILEGVVARHASGAYGEGDDTWRGFAEVVGQLADRALGLTSRLSPKRPPGGPAPTGRRPASR
jgi:hypothetical protein